MTAAWLGDRLQVLRDEVMAQSFSSLGMSCLETHECIRAGTGSESWVGDGAASWVETVAETPMQASSRSPDGNPAAPYSTPPASLNQPLWREGSPGGPGEGSSKKLWPVSVWLHLQGLPWEGALGLVSMGVTGGIQWF